MTSCLNIIFVWFQNTEEICHLLDTKDFTRVKYIDAKLTKTSSINIAKDIATTIWGLAIPELKYRNHALGSKSTYLTDQQGSPEKLSCEIFISRETKTSKWTRS